MDGKIVIGLSTGICKEVVVCLYNGKQQFTGRNYNYIFCAGTHLKVVKGYGYLHMIYICVSTVYLCV